VAQGNATLGQRKIDWNDMFSKYQNLQTQIIQHDSNLRSRDKQIADNLIRATIAEEAAIALKSQLQSIQTQLESVEKEREAQMTLVAKLTLAAAAVNVSSAIPANTVQLEKELDETKMALIRIEQEKKDLDDRCSSLRAMNEELMGMLEKMYAERYASDI
jgi:chromosome segregation ATPase